MATLYVIEQGAALNCDGERIIVARENETLGSVPLIKLDDVIIFGNAGITTPAMKRLLDRGIEVTFMTTSGRYHGRLIGAATAHVALRRAQYRRADDPAWSLGTAQRCVEGKLRNCRSVLQRFARQRTTVDPEIPAAIADIQGLIERVQRTTKLSALTGVEGRATAQYFRGLRSLFADDWGFHRRNRRPPADPINVLLSLGYTLLTHKMLGMVQAVGFDPYQGYLHQLNYNRPSLALDLIEEFRPILVDSFVVRCCTEGLLNLNDFATSDDPERPIVLEADAKRRFVAAFEERLRLEVTHPEGAGDRPGKVSYLRCLELQARRLARAVQQNTTYQPWSIR